MNVSIVIPTYNSNQFIKETLDSVCACFEGGELDYEILLIDDCSDDIDSLKEKAKNYSNIRVIEKKEKSNAAMSRNIGFNNSLSDFVFFLDSDDKFSQNHIEIRMKEHIDRNLGVIFGGFRCNGIENIITEYTNTDFRDFLFKCRGDIRSSTISIYKPYHKGTLFDVKQNKHQDWGFGIRCTDSKELVGLAKVSSVYIDTKANEKRMSNKSDITASQYFLDRYIDDMEHQIQFVKMHIKSAILNSDSAALHFYREKLYEAFKSNICENNKALAIIVLSYLPKSLIKIMSIFRK